MRGFVLEEVLRYRFSAVGSFVIEKVCVVGLFVVVLMFLCRMKYCVVSDIPLL